MAEQDISASERAYQAIRDDILDGTHQPGTMLGEAGLAQALGLSRTPIRAALTRLQNEGWITVYPKRGALVQGLSDRAVAEFSDARFVLETAGVDRAPEARRHRLADELESSVLLQRDALVSENMRDFIDLTLRFHRGFVEASGNSVLVELYDRLADRQRCVLHAAGPRLLERCEEIIGEHQQLVAQLRAGNVAEFAQVLRGHIGEVIPGHDHDLAYLSPSVTAQQ